MNGTGFTADSFLSRHKNFMKALWYISCFLLAVIVRTYQLGDIPYGIHLDEAGMGYDAWSLQKYHVDRWLNSFPVYLINFGGGQSALNAYLCAIFIRLFGKGDWDVIWMRMPGVVLNLAGYIAGLSLIGRILEKKWKMLSAFVLAVLPYFIMQCRFGLDCNLLVNMLTVSLCLLCLSLEYGKTWLFLLTGLIYGVTYYSYAVSYIPNTLLLLCITVYLLAKDRRLFRRLLCVWIPAGVVALPLFLMILVNNFDLAQINLGVITITKIPEYRGSEFVFNLPTVLRNSGVVLSSILTKDHIAYNAFDKFYTMYKISIPFILVGLCDYTRHMMNHLKKRTSDVDYGFFLWMVFILYFIFGCCLGGDSANVNRMNGIFFSQFFLLMWGIRKIYDMIARKYVKCAKVFVGLLCVVYLFDFGAFARYYFVDYKTDIYPQFIFADTYEGILQHLQENHLDDRQIYVSDSQISESDAYIYYMLSARSNPYEVNLPGNGGPYIENLCFGSFDWIEESAVYIVRETDAECIELLKENGLELQYSEGMYQCYYS